ncbi:Lysophospholipase, alpha-beta hydrolase superfamily [Rubrivivax sp. A210]|uniref:alpha/beta fold hydrolase n=1 Tax=Rubrivivax sp. A210 TaxID=2772301 RepID=UPI00191A3B4A|nr:alpha/beta hydrolase [Rubrivivax sp. A210]CAD5371319.1 Lysophospholipase, alpha-beta hydrolase superfamily [Rubrivivax sp. A210]
MVKTWVLLRGLTREQAHWGEFPSTLAQALPGTRIVTVDLPGAGQLRHQACPWRVEAMVQACRDQLAEAGAAPPYALLGLSLGGMVASAWARAWPQELAALVLVNTSLRPYSPPGRRLRAALWPQLLRLLASDRGAEEAILRLTSSRPERHAQALACWQAVRESRPVSRANALRQLLAAARYRWSGPAPALPLLLACSEGDRLVDPGCSRLIARAWSAEIVSHPRAGHDLPLDDGPWLAQRIAQWQAAQRVAPAR